MKKFLHDFKEFALKGNVIDMAVGVVIGGAFGKIVTSLVNDIINPVIGVITGGNSLDALKTVIKAAEVAADGTVTEEVAILWGVWLQTILDFLIVALCIFIILRAFMNMQQKFEEKVLKKKKEEEAAAPAGPTDDEIKIETLREIRDLLKEKKN